MKFFHKAKDGGPQSNVTGYWLIEWKGGFSIALLRFDMGAREAFHSHAFHAVSWLISGHLREEVLSLGRPVLDILPSLKPFFTSRYRIHRVHGVSKTSWALTIRGPWLDKWYEYFDNPGRVVTLTHGRKVLKNVHSNN